MRIVFNWLTALLAIAVLGVTLNILFALRAQTERSLEDGVRNIVASFESPAAMLGEPTDVIVDFDSAELAAASAMRASFLRGIVVTKTVINGDQREVAIVPYDLFVLSERNWRSQISTWRIVPLNEGTKNYGYLYLNVDRSAVTSISRAIYAVSAALVATLLVLVGRLFFQQTTIQRVGGELEKRERELIRIERLALAGQLTANLLHDLKKPVLSLRHQLEDLPSAAELTATELEKLKAGMNEQVRLFLQMLSDTSIERFVKSDRVSEEYADVNDILRSSTRLVHYERGGVELVEDYGKDLPAILVQPYRLIQVFSNVILNAYQAMKGNGTLRVETRRADGGIEIEICDDGPGIPREIIESVFDPFFTTKGESEGSGLGLAISRLIIEGMGGKIGVESPAGGPTTFRVWLPEHPRKEA